MVIKYISTEEKKKSNTAHERNKKVNEWQPKASWPYIFVPSPLFPYKGK